MLAASCHVFRLAFKVAVKTGKPGIRPIGYREGQSERIPEWIRLNFSLAKRPICQSQVQWRPSQQDRPKIKIVQSRPAMAFKINLSPVAASQRHATAQSALYLAP